MKKFLASILIVWLAGVTCVLCCEPFAAAQEEDSCPMTGHACCKKKQDSSNATGSFLADGDQAVSCCNSSKPKALTIQNVAYSFEKVEIAEAVIVASPVYSQSPVKNTLPKTLRPLIPDRGGTYLKNCVFRI